MTNTTLKTEKRSDYRKFVPSVLKGDHTFNSRKDYGNIEELIASIKENGILLPLKGYRDPSDKKNIIITDGFRRLTAIHALAENGWNEYVPVTIVKLSEYPVEKQLLDQFILNSGKNLNSLEEGILFQRLLSEGLTQQDIATKTGRSQGHISQVLSIANAPKEITDKIVQGIIAPSMVFQVIKSTTDTVAQIKMINDAIENAKVEKNEDVETSTEETDNITDVKTPVKVTSKNFKSLAKSPLKTLEMSLEELSDSEDYEAIKKVYNLLKKKVTVDEFVSSFKGE